MPDHRAPEWRRPPRRFGSIEPVDHDPAWIEILERNAVPLLVGTAALVLALAAYVFGVDWFVGHLG